MGTVRVFNPKIRTKRFYWGHKLALKVAIIGAGKRVTYTILPAVWALGERAEIVQINTRTPQDVKLPDGNVIRTSTDLNSLMLESIDLLIVAVGTNSIRQILMQLGKKDGRSNVNLVMDTPPLRLSDFRRTKIFDGYKSVSVGEDWSKISTIIAAKKIIEDGEIGELRTIRLDHLSYRYHGLAALKELASVKTVSSINRRALGGNFFGTHVKLKRKISGFTIEPRDYDNGRFLVLGTRGYISDFKLGVSGKARFEIGYPETKTGWYQPISINNKLQDADEVEQFMAAQPYDYLEDNSQINRLKIRGYARLLEEVSNGLPGYPISDGLYDYLAVALAEKTGRFYDISFSGNQSSLVQRLMRLHAN